MLSLSNTILTYSGVISNCLLLCSASNKGIKNIDRGISILDASIFVEGIKQKVSAGLKLILIVLAVNHCHLQLILRLIFSLIDSVSC